MLKANQHMRYMWIPHTDAVVVVTNNPHSPGAALPPAPAAHSDTERMAPLHKLLQVPDTCPKPSFPVQLDLLLSSTLDVQPWFPLLCMSVRCGTIH